MKRAATALLTAGLFVLSVPSASAVEPFRLADQVTDQVGVLDTATVDPALTELRDETGVQLFVVFVDSFDGQDGQSWADATARTSGLGTDDVLLAVATDDRAYAYSVALEFALDETAMGEVTRDTEAELADDDWSGAVVAGAESLQDELSPSYTVWWVVGFLAVAGVVVIAVVSLVRWRRNRPEVTGPTPEFAGRPTEELLTLADGLLVQADDAVRSAAQELQFAAAEFGTERTAGFAGVLDRARTALTQAFTARQSLDDDVPETEEQRRRVLADVIEACRSTGRTLDEASDEIDTLRDLVRRAPAVLDGVEAKLPGLRASIEPSRALLSRLREEFGEPALVSVADAVSQARDLVGTAERSCAQARAALRDPSRSGEVVDGVRSAEAAAAQAEQLLAGIARTEADLRRAVVEVPLVLARLESASEPGVQAVVEQARVGARTDPLGTLHRLLEAEKALAASREQAAVLEQTLIAARAEIWAADEFIAARRGAVGPQARTHLGEAQRHLDQAVALTSNDPAAAVEHARQADALAERASARARSDVDAWQTSQQNARANSQDDVGAVLGGILWGAGTSSRRRSGWSGGFGGGSFGGSSRGSSRSSRPSRSSGRRSGGGGRRSSGGRF